MTPDTCIIQTQVLVVGHTCVDLIHHVPHTPTPNHKVKATKTHMELGGGAARVALKLHELAVPNHVIHVLGTRSDPITQITCEQMHHLDHTCVHVESPASVSHVWCDQMGNRTISSYQSDQVTQADLPFLLNVDARVALFDNYRLPLMQSVRQNLKNTCVQILDMDQPCVKSDLAQFMGFDQIWFSEEAYKASGLSLTSLAQHLNTPVVGFTQGALPVVWCAQGEIHMVSPPKITHMFHTVGAGDVFRAGLALGILQGLHTHACVELACELAVDHLTASGT